MVSLVFYILQLPHTVISNSEKLTHPIIQYLLCFLYVKFIVPLASLITFQNDYATVIK